MEQRTRIASDMNGEDHASVDQSGVEAAPRPRRLLVADDEHLAATMMARHLASLGYEVIGPAGDGKEAVAIGRRELPDLAVLDIKMPGMTGLQAAAVFFHELGVPVVIVSAYADESFEIEARQCGVFGYLVKPITHDQLRIGVSVAWGRYSAWAQQGAEVKSLKERLEHRKVIEQAKWVLVSRKSITEPEAMKLLQKQARNTRQSLVEVSRTLLEADHLMGE